MSLNKYWQIIWIAIGHAFNMQYENINIQYKLQISKSNMSMYHFVCTNLSLALGAYKFNVTMESTTSSCCPELENRDEQRLLYAKLSHMDQWPSEKADWPTAILHVAGNFTETMQIQEQVENFILKTTRQKYAHSVRIWSAVRWFECDQICLDRVSEDRIAEMGQVQPDSE